MEYIKYTDLNFRIQHDGIVSDASMCIKYSIRFSSFYGRIVALINQMLLTQCNDGIIMGRRDNDVDAIYRKGWNLTKSIN